MRQGVMGNASIFARQLGNALDLAVCIYSKDFGSSKLAGWKYITRVIRAPI